MCKQSSKCKGQVCLLTFVEQILCIELMTGFYFKIDILIIKFRNKGHLYARWLALIICNQGQHLIVEENVVKIQDLVNGFIL